MTATIHARKFDYEELEDGQIRCLFPACRRTFGTLKAFGGHVSTHGDRAAGTRTANRDDSFWNLIARAMVLCPPHIEVTVSNRRPDTVTPGG